MGNIIRRPKRFSASKDSRPGKHSGSGKKKPAQTYQNHNSDQPQQVAGTTPPQQLDDPEEEEAINRIRATLRNDLETFVLNHLLMSVQFFRNFEEETEAIRSVDRSSETTLHNRHCLMPDRMLEAVSRHVQFQTDNPKKQYAETIAAQRLFVVQDNIELCTDLDSVHYASVDGPNYYVVPEPSRRKGYTRLRCEESMISKIRCTTYEAVDDGGEFIYDEPIYGSNLEASDSSLPTDDGSHSGHTINEESQYNQQDITTHVPERQLLSLENISEGKIDEQLPQMERKHYTKKLYAKTISLPDLSDEDPKRESDSSSGYKSGGSSKSQSLQKLNNASDYSYSTIKNLMMPRKLADCTLGRIPINSSEIPNECFQRVTTKILDDEDQKNKLFKTQHFLNSDVFMCNFVDLFSHRFANALGFNEESVEEATKVSAKIICDKFHRIHGELLLEDHYEVIPTLHCNEWPSHAKEWLQRDRKTTIKDMVKYTWPTVLMVQKVKAMGYHVLPMGYMLKRGDRQSRLIEWQIAFPEAERYLESCLFPGQIRCYLSTMTLYKQFVEPLETQLGLLPSHIRTLLFWQCENHPYPWPEDRPGETMKVFLSKIYNALREKRIEDYFIRKRNLLDSSPEDELHAAQERIFRIQEHLTTHMLLAISNLRFKENETGGRFYPLLDYKQLYKILTLENLITLNNPNLRGRTVSTNHPSFEKQGNTGVEQDEKDPLDLWKGVQTKNPHQKFAENVQNRLKQKNAASKQAAPTGSTETMDVKARIKKGADPLRRKMILELFISHFIKMAKASHEFRTLKQAAFYLQQADRLTTLLNEEPIEKDTAASFHKIINSLHHKFQNPTPNTPTRQEENSQPRGEQVFIRTLQPLPEDTVQHPDIDRAPLVVTHAEVHSRHNAALKVVGGSEPRQVVRLSNVPEQEYDEIVEENEETSL